MRNKYTGTKQERIRQASKSWKERNPEKVLNKRYKERYGITYEEYRAMLLNQNRLCFLCGTHELESRNQKLCVDHCHVSGKIRKLLCHNCNCALGLLKDDVKILERVINYLKAKW